jgi:tRNA(Ile)-lysidine synthetase-like protein
MECSVELLPRQEEGEDIPCSDTEQPYVLRSPREGDTVERDGRTTPVKELLYELGVPAEERSLVPLLQNRRGIVAVCAAPWIGSTFVAERPNTDPPTVDSWIRVRFHYTGDST